MAWRARTVAGFAVLLVSLPQVGCNASGAPSSRGHDTELCDSVDAGAGEELSLLQLPTQDGYLALVGAPGHRRSPESVERNTRAGLRTTSHLVGESASPAICLSVVVIVFFVAHLLALLSEISVTMLGFRPGPIHEAVEQVAVPARGLPMVGLLIVVAQLRSEELGGRPGPGRYGLPAWWMNLAEVLVAVATAAAFAWQLLTIALAPPAGEDKPSRLRLLSSRVSAGMRTVAILVQLFFVAVVIVGTTLMGEPFDIWLKVGRLDMSSSVACTVNLAIQHFIVFLALLLAAGVDELGQRGPGRATKAFRVGVLSQSLGPLLGFGIYVARSRALVLTESSGNVQRWATVFFCFAVYGMIGHTIFAIVTAAFEDASKELAEGGSDTRRNRGLAFCRFVRELSMACVLIGAVGIVSSILLLQDPLGWEETPKLSTSFMCVVVLAVQSFASHIVSFLGGLVQPHTSEERRAVFDSLKHAKDTDVLCGILCVLFIAARVRAYTFAYLALPQHWVQNAMYACMWASLLHWALSIASGAASADGAEEPKAVVLYGRVLCLGIVYAGVISVLVGMAVMDGDNIVVSK